MNNKFKEIEDFLVEQSVGDYIVDYYELFLDRFFEGYPINIDFYVDALTGTLYGNFDEDDIAEYCDIVIEKYGQAKNDFDKMMEQWKKERTEEKRLFYSDYMA